MRRSVSYRISEAAWLIAAALCIGSAWNPSFAVEDHVDVGEPQSAASFHAPDLQLAGFITALLENNPELHAARSTWRAGVQRVPQARSLPDPQLQVRYFAETPETRVGPQEAGLGLHQSLPWRGKRALQGDRAAHLAGSMGWEVRALERELVAELKRSYYDAAYYQEALAINFEERDLLEHFERIALTRYSTGEGIQQSVMKVQTEITRLLDQETALAQQLDRLTRRIAQLLGRPDAELVLHHIHLPPLNTEHDAHTLALDACLERPEVRAAKERIEADTLWSRRQALESRPDFRVGLEYIYVDHREDALGMDNPPEDNGQDVVALVAGINIPLHRKRIRAGIAEARESTRAREEALTATQDRIRFEVQDASLRLESLAEREGLYQEVLIPQAEGSLASAESAYVTDRLGFLDLLDAERVLFQSRRMLHRILADQWIAATDLERAAGRMFPPSAREAS
jgi:outer membrane protein TolC